MSGSILAGLALDGTTAEGVEASEETVNLLEAILSRLGYPDQAQGALRVTAVAGTLPTVTTVSSVSNVVAIGGQNAIYDQYAAMLACGQANRNRITVS